MVNTVLNKGVKTKNFHLWFLFFFVFSFSFAQERKEEYDFRGNLKKVYFLNQDGKKTGQEVSYFWNQKKRTVKSWDNGKLKDSVVRYNDQGKIKSIGYIKTNKLTFYEGESREIKIEEVTLKNGKENGVGILFKLNGEAYAFEQYEEGEKVGIIMLTENYFLKAIAFENTAPKYLLLYCYENGQVQSINTGGVHNDGILLRFYDNGKLKYWVRLNEGRKDECNIFIMRKVSFLKKSFLKKGIY